AGGRGIFRAGVGVLGLGALAFLAALVLLLVLIALFAFLLVGIGTAVLAHVERVEQVMDDVAEQRLVLDQLFEPVEVLAGAVLDQRPPQLDQAPRRRRRRLPGEALAHQHGESVLDRRIGAVA